MVNCLLFLGKYASLGSDSTISTERTTAMSENELALKIQQFLDSLRLKVSDIGLKRIKAACAVSKLGHQRQTRVSGEPYFMHPLRVAESLAFELGVTDSDLIIAAILHDTMEDVPELEQEVLATLFNKRIAGIVSNLTSPVDHDDPNYEEDRAVYFRRLQTGRVEEQIIKLADRLDNIRTLAACTPERRQKKIQQTVEFLLPMIVSIEHAKHAVIASLLREKFRLALAAAEAL